MFARSGLKAVRACRQKLQLSNPAQKIRVRKYGSAPSNWPTNIKYLDEIEWNGHKDHIRSNLKVSDLNQQKQKTFVDPKRVVVEVKRIDDPSHPLYAQYGLFAKSNIAANTIIGRYTGEIVLDPKNSNYAYWIGSIGDTSYYLDAKIAGNEMRFINDYRGINNSPNVVFARISQSNGTFTDLCIVTTRNISAAEEFLVDYGLGFWA